MYDTGQQMKRSRLLPHLVPAHDRPPGKTFPPGRSQGQAMLDGGAPEERKK